MLLQAAAPDADADSLAAVEDTLEMLDPAIETTLAWSCPACGAAWTELLDAASLLASELGSQAQQVLAEVATLALAYHWSERDILAMPAQRRRFYLAAAS